MSLYYKVYFLLGCLFCTTVVISNLIFQKFVSITIPYIIELNISVGVLLYPITFLISDLVTEFYGKEKSKIIINTTILISFIVMILLYISIELPATSWSPISSLEFKKTFNVYGIGSLASLIAVYLGQLADIHIFSWIKIKTNSKHLWLRNNVSTILAQIIDTSTVLTLLCIFQIVPWTQFNTIFIGSIIFKLIAALLDTPFCYLGHALMKKYIKHQKHQYYNYEETNTITP